jgi:hypothetical protein
MAAVTGQVPEFAPIARFPGRPLIQYVIIQCRKAKALADVIVVTDILASPTLRKNSARWK